MPAMRMLTHLCTIGGGWMIDCMALATKFVIRKLEMATDAMKSVTYNIELRASYK